MEYITVKEAAKKWNISIRRVQYLCKNNMIPNAVRFGKVWSIPSDSEKPKDGRYKMQNEEHINLEQQFFNSISESKDIFRKIVESFIYPIHVFKANGDSYMFNDSFIRAFKIEDTDLFRNSYNVLKDTNTERWGIKDFIQKAFSGEVVQITEVYLPVEDLIHMYSSKDLGYEKIYLSIATFPILDNDNKLEYVVAVYIISRHYKDREEIMKAKDYIDKHYLEKLCIDKVASNVNLSKYHFIRLFKKHIGCTPYSYYQGLKINKLKERLCDVNISISQAFADCGLDYNGSFVKLFKEKVGMTPSQYRKMNIK